MARRDVLVAQQPAYLPWCGYFSRLLDVDRLIILDHVQFSERGRQHRNHIRAPGGGTLRLTVPIRRRFGQPLSEVRIADQPWAARHWRSIAEAYQRAPYWQENVAALGELYSRPWTHLADLNIALTGWLLDSFGMDVELLRSTSIAPTGTKTQMLIDLCRRTGARVLRVGTGAPGYLDFRALAEAAIGVEVAVFSSQTRGPGSNSPTPALAALDLLLHHGPRARGLLARGSMVRPWDGATPS